MSIVDASIVLVITVFLTRHVSLYNQYGWPFVFIHFYLSIALLLIAAMNVLKTTTITNVTVLFSVLAFVVPYLIARWTMGSNQNVWKE